MLLPVTESATLAAIVSVVADSVNPAMSPVEKWGIAGLCMVIIFVLYQRDERRQKDREDERKAAEAERLEVAKQQLASSEATNIKLTDLLERSIKAQVNSTVAVNNVNATLRSLQCPGMGKVVLPPTPSNDGE